MTDPLHWTREHPRRQRHHNPRRRRLHPHRHRRGYPNGLARSALHHRPLHRKAVATVGRPNPDDLIWAFCHFLFLTVYVFFDLGAHEIRDEYVVSRLSPFLSWFELTLTRALPYMEPTLNHSRHVSPLSLCRLVEEMALVIVPSRPLIIRRTSQEISGVPAGARARRRRARAFFEECSIQYY